MSPVCAPVRAWANWKSAMVCVSTLYCDGMPAIAVE